jgi:hypothetical protein
LAVCFRWLYRRNPVAGTTQRSHVSTTELCASSLMVWGPPTSPMQMRVILIHSRPVLCYCSYLHRFCCLELMKNLRRNRNEDPRARVRNSCEV